MQRIESKKGVSSIIASVFLIIIIIISISLMAVSLIKLVKLPALSPENSCPLLLSKKPLSIEKVCFNQETNKIEATVQRNSDEIKIDSMKFILDNESYICGDFCGNCQLMDKGASQKYYFTTTTKKEITLVANGCLLERKPIKGC